jgi:KDO2-lipid IV(A) lauroyltransferase
LVRDILRAIGISVVETSIALWGSDSKFKGRYTVKGVEHIEAVQAEGKGIILMGCHQTALDLAGRILASHIAFDVLYRRDPNPLLSYMISQARERFAKSAIPRDDTRQLIKNLRKGHSIWYAPDQDYSIKHSVFAPFFGVNAATIIGTARIAQMGQAKVIPMSYYRNAQGHYEIEFYEPLSNFPSGDDVADATRTNAVIEEIIRRQPDQYLWVHRRFKTRPPGEASFYTRKK